jgi:hypothetical protein
LYLAAAIGQERGHNMAAMGYFLNRAVKAVGHPRAMEPLAKRHV